MAELRLLGLEHLDKTIRSRQKLEYVKRIVMEKGLATQIGYLQNLSRIEMHFNDYLNRRLKDELFHIHIHTKPLSEQRKVVNRFLDQIDEEEGNPMTAYENQAKPLANTAPAQLGTSNKDKSTVGGESPLIFASTNFGKVTQSYSEKRLQTILPRLVKHREQLLNTTLLKMENDRASRLNAFLPHLVTKSNNKNKRRKNQPSAKAMVVVHSSEANRGIETPISPVLAAVASVNIDKRHQPLGQQPSDAAKRHKDPVSRTKSDADRKAMSTRSSDVRMSTVVKTNSNAPKQAPPSNIFDAIQNEEISVEERDRINRINMLRLLAGMTALPTAAANWNREAAAGGPARKKQDESREINTASTPGCPGLRDPLPFDLPKPRLKKKERSRINRPVPLAARLLNSRYRIQCKKIEETYLTSWKERVLSEDKWRLIDMRRQQEEEKLAKTTGKNKDQFIEAQLLAKQQLRVVKSIPLAPERSDLDPTNFSQSDDIEEAIAEEQ